MRVVCAEKEQHYWHTKEEFLRRSILSPVIDLFPHVEIIVSASVKLEWYSSDPVKHKE
jgi:hypothetical protein